MASIKGGVKLDVSFCPIQVFEDLRCKCYNKVRKEVFPYEGGQDMFQLAIIIRLLAFAGFVACVYGGNILYTIGLCGVTMECGKSLSIAILMRTRFLGNWLKLWIRLDGKDVEHVTCTFTTFSLLSNFNCTTEMFKFHT